MEWFLSAVPECTATGYTDPEPHDGQYPYGHTIADTPLWRALRERSLRIWLRRPDLLPPPYKDATKAEGLQRLYSLTYYDPTRWVCDGCLRTYPVSLHDYPGYWPVSACPHQQPRVLGICPRHIQMAVKYTRLENMGRLNHDQKVHLQALLAPREFRAPTRPNLTIVPRPLVDVGSWATIHDAKFVTYTEFWYHGDNLRGPVSTYTLGALRICAHQFFDFTYPNWRQRPMSALCMLVEQAVERPDNSVWRWECEWCMTRFDVFCNMFKLGIAV